MGDALGSWPFRNLTLTIFIVASVSLILRTSPYKTDWGNSIQPRVCTRIG